MTQAVQCQSVTILLTHNPGISNHLMCICVLHVLPHYVLCVACVFILLDVSEKLREKLEILNWKKFRSFCHKYHKSYNFTAFAALEQDYEMAHI